MVNFTTLVYTLESLGISDVLLPFILVFTLVFAILQKSKIFESSGSEGGRTKPFNIVIALAMSLAVVIPHVLGYYPPGADIVDIINSALPQVSIILVAVLMALLIIGLFGGRAEWKGPLTGWIAFLSFIVIGYIFGRAAGWFIYLPDWLYWLDNPDTQALIVVVGVFALIIWYITKEETPADKEQAVDKFRDSWSKLFGGNE